MKQYSYIIKADNFDKSGKISANNTKEVSHKCIELLELRGSKECKITIKPIK